MANTKQQQSEYSFHPQLCHICGCDVELISKKKIHPAGPENEFVYRCTSTGCDSYVGCRPGSRVAAGSLATPRTRMARREAHGAMAELIKSHRMDKAQAYEWMQHLLNLPYNRRGIAWLRAGECHTLVVEINAQLNNTRADSAKRGIASLRALFNNKPNPPDQPNNHNQERMEALGDRLRIMELMTHS
jgi:hypothetical protein